MRTRTFDGRTFAAIAGAAVVGGLWAGLNLWRAGDVRDPEVYPALIWTVFATPFVTFFGWAWARPKERGLAALICFCVYFFAILIAARVERLLLGEAQAEAAGHALYFRLTLALDLLGCLGAALQRALAIGTIPAPTESQTRRMSSEL